MIGWNAGMISFTSQESSWHLLPNAGKAFDNDTRHAKFLTSVTRQSHERMICQDYSWKHILQGGNKTSFLIQLLYQECFIHVKRICFIGLEFKFALVKIQFNCMGIVLSTKKQFISTT